MTHPVFWTTLYRSELGLICALDVKGKARVQDKGLQAIPDCGSSSSRFYEKTAPTTAASLIFSNMQHMVDVENNEQSDPARNPPDDGQRRAEGVNKHSVEYLVHLAS